MIQVGDKLLDRYEIISPLGEGGMASVFRACDHRFHDREVAIKVIQLGDLPAENDQSSGMDSTMVKPRTPSNLNREQAFKLFNREAQLLQQLNHPNLPTIHDYFIIDDEGYIVMTLVQGQSLLDVLVGNSNSLPGDKVSDWLMQVLDTLEYCHSQGVIHRDLKPENLLLSPDGKIFLIDFGIAKVLVPGKAVTSTGIAILTPGYAPPEQYSSREYSTDPRSDLYSIGATAYKLLTGMTPIEASERMAGAPLPDPRSLNPVISNRLRNFILTCMKLSKEDRPQNAVAAKMLLLSDTTKPRRIISSKKPIHILLINHWKKIGLGAAVLLLLAGLIWVIGNWPKGIPQEPEITNPTPTFTGTPAEVTRTFTEAPSQTPAITIVSPTPVESGAVSGATTVIPGNPGPCTTIGQTKISDVDGMTQVCVPAGEFIMGSNDGLEDQRPVHTVALAAYWLDQTEVTNAQYDECVAAGGCKKPGFSSSYTHTNYYGNPDYADYPVVWVDYQKAAAYCAWAGRSLPTEAEWEKAARGPGGNTYPWGNNPPAVNLANFGLNVGDTTPVKDYPAGTSPYGALNMAGNVWEWVQDWYGNYNYASVENPTGPQTGTWRVLRGGSFSDNDYLTATYRGNHNPVFSEKTFGFRCVERIQPVAQSTPTLDPNARPACTRAGQVWTSPADGSDLVCVPAGEFSMGSNNGESNEKPVHTIYLDAYWIDQYEITNAKFARFLNEMGTKPLFDGVVLDVNDMVLYDTTSDEDWTNRIDYSTENRTYFVVAEYENHPVSMVSWYGAEAYCQWAGRQLPTEAQWEKAARGPDERMYPWGNSFEPDLANGGITDSKTQQNMDSFSETSPVGSYSRSVSPYFVFDMAGNIFEWVRDWYSDDFYNWTQPSNPLNTIDSTWKVIRGGSFLSKLEYYLRTTYRVRTHPDDYGNGLGFRCSY